ncbi:hypothetical protein ACLOJK_025551, partial [Asimina triloba]
MGRGGIVATRRRRRRRRSEERRRSSSNNENKSNDDGSVLLRLVVFVLLGVVQAGFEHEGRGGNGRRNGLDGVWHSYTGWLEERAKTHLNLILGSGETAGESGISASIRGFRFQNPAQVSQPETQKERESKTEV